ncbi:MAG TPA: response regulator transcription factor, partial [Myxococcales bacterium]
MDPLRVALVDDHLLFREGLRAMLASAPDLEIVAEASNAQEALPAIRESNPEVVVLDVMLPGMSGIGIARELLKEDPGRRVLALSMVADESHVADALQAGVLGYACKAQSAKEVVDAIRTVARGETYLAPQVSGFVVSDYRRLRNGGESAARLPTASLTAREREI